MAVGTNASPESCYKRNRYLADHVECLVAVYDNDRAVRSETGQTVRYAEKIKKPIILSHPDTVVIVGYI